MSQDRYKRSVHKASKMIRHLGRAVRGARAFFVFRDRSDPSQPQIIACHPPLSDEALLRALGSDYVVCESISEDAEHQAFVGVASEGAFDNRELASEMTVVAAQSLAGEMVSDVESHDTTTGLPDRTAFETLLADQVACGADGVAVLVIDLERLHRVTARFGDAGVEELMRILSSRLSEALEGCGRLGRLGRGRFGVLFTCDATEHGVLATAALIHEVLRERVRLTGEDIFVTGTIGVALSCGERPDAHLLHDADLAISQAKGAGGNATRVFRPGMHNVLAFQLLRERDIRLAVARDEFTVFFQPIVGAMRGGLHAFEALLRWRNPEEGLLPPSTFIDVLLETGLIDIVGRRVIREACEHAARWMALSGTLVPVSVNIAPIQLYAEDFCGEIARTLAMTGLPAEGLILELTENALIDDPARVRATLQSLKDLGVRVLIDDFGTGYSSLTYLHELPVSGIKLDRMWFHAIDHSATQREIVRTIVGLAHFMHMDVVAEGIENAEQLTAARDLHCDFAQGYCFARPLDAENATRYLARNLPRQAVA